MTNPAKNSQHESGEFCHKLAGNHYENFPIASWLLPRNLRAPVEAIYAFARTADDYADEGTLTPQERLALLDGYANSLNEIKHGRIPQTPLFIALARTIQQHRLPVEPFYALLSAFKQDVTKSRYTNFEEVQDYCQRSANPIGHLMLMLFERDTPENRVYADKLCTGLQLVNFLQDIPEDYVKGRVYLPQEAMQHFGVNETHIRERRADPAWRAFMAAEIERVRGLLLASVPLVRKMPGRYAWELRFIVAGGLQVLNKLARQNSRQFATSARLTTLDWIKVAARTLKLG